MRVAKVKSGKIKHSGILKTAAGLFALGRNDYADVTAFRKDSFFRDCLQLNAVPSEETLRQRLDELALLQELFALIRSGNVELLGKAPEFGFEGTPQSKYIPLDIDVSPFDNSGSSKKEFPGLTRIMMATHRFLLTLELMAICSTTKCAQEVSTAIKARWNLSGNG